ncbi:MAG: hypothetical protein CMJ18_06370 [Phycisphaeraceae bacterium]|nr:hypothetical protein [Phycisphaeraceae bacterium]
MAEAARKIKRSSASLTGGIVVAVTVTILALLVTGELGWDVTARWMTSVVVGGTMGAWVRIADL